MDTLVKNLDKKLNTWEPGISEVVREYLKEIIELADQNALDLLKSRPGNRLRWRS
ncbi:hypothetical protein JXI42_10510 [bacterium]|nr:hypothetical protein [bacterium]